MANWEDMKPVVAMIVLQFTYAGLNLLTRVAVVQGMSPRVFVVYRHAIATLFIAPFAFISGRRESNRASMGLKSFSLIFIAALVGVVIDQNMYNEGLYLASASVASATANLVPAITFILASILGFERVNIRSLRSIAKIIGTIVCVGGAMIMTLLRGPKLLNNSNEHLRLLASMFGYGGGDGGGGDNWIIGCLFLMGSCCCWATWLTLQVPLAACYPDPVSLSAWMCLFATLQGAVVTFVLERDLNIWMPTSKLQIGCVIYTGVVGSGVAFFVHSWTIARKGPVFSAMFNPLCTVIVTSLAAIFLHEKVYLGSMAGAIGVVAGLYIVLWGKAKDMSPIVLEEKPSPPNQTDLEQSLLLNDSPVGAIR